MFCRSCRSVSPSCTTALWDSVVQVWCYLGHNESNADFAIAAVFDSMDALAAYSGHPEHHAIIQELISPYLTARSATQFSPNEGVTAH